MLQSTRNRLVAPGIASRSGLEALFVEPWTDLPRDVSRLIAAVARPDAGATAGATPGAAGAWVPAVDVEEGEDAVRLSFEVPGVAPDALDVTVDDRVLTVSGERRLERAAERAEGRAAYRLERRYGRFARSLALPETVDVDRIEARYEHGVLHLTLPKRPEAQPRRIEIRTDAAAPADQRRIEGAGSEA